MNSFINIQKDYNPSSNFWELNPHLIYVKPFSLLYATDKGGKVSSKTMWCIVWLSDPDEEINKYYRLPYDERIEVCKEYNPGFNEFDEIVSNCIEQYEQVCLTTTERVYKQEKEKLLKRSEFLRKAEYNFDTMRDLDYAYAQSKKIWDDYARIEKDFFDAKKTSSRVYGGRKLTYRERGKLMPDNE